MAATDERIEALYLRDGLPGTGELMGKAIKPGQRGFQVRRVDDGVEVSRPSHNDPKLEQVFYLPAGGAFVLVSQRPRNTDATKSTPRRVRDQDAPGAEPAGGGTRSTGRPAEGNG